MSNVPTFRTSRLILREVTEADVPSYQKHFVDYEVVRHLAAGVPWPYPEDGVVSYLKSEVFPYQGTEKWVWGITLSENPSAVIGAIELLRKASPANRGFWLGREFWGRGYMTEATIPVTDYAFEALGFESLVFANAVGNRRSERIKEKSGARLVRIEPAEYVDPDLREKAVYELSKESWLNYSREIKVTNDS